jgi:hypothetical protein
VNIRDAILAVAGYQAAIAISSPAVIQVAKVWPYFPPQSVAIADSPAFINEWIFDKEVRTTNGLRQQFYTDHMQLFVYDADSNQAADIATAFMEAIVDTFDAHETLGGAAFRTHLRGSGGGNRPTLFPVTWAGYTFIGLDLFLDVELTEGKTYAP